MIKLPFVQAPISDANGKPTRAFYAVLAQIIQGVEGQISDLTDLVNGLADVAKSLGSPEGSTANIISVSQALSAKVDNTRAVTGAASIQGGSALSKDVVLTLKGDKNVPGAHMVYSTDENGARGWFPQSLPSYMTTDYLAEGADNLYFTDARAQDAVGAALANSANVTLAYDDAANTITANLTTLADAGGGSLLCLVRDAWGRITGTSTPSTTDLAEGSNLYYTDARADTRITLQKGQPSGLATLDSGGKLDAGQLPALAITETFVVSTQAAMLALSAQQGDVCVRTDLNDSFILTTNDPTTLANWQELETPVDGVVNFNGRTGSVVPATGDYTFSQIGSTPTTLAGYGITDAATDAQGTKADTALQPANNLSDVANTTTARSNLGVVIPKGYIDGLQVQWVSATALTISSGAAYIESTGTILQSDSAIALTGLVLAANTWYHLYLYDNAGTPAVECVTTAPATPYSGTARSKTGDTTRRYVGSVLTDTSGNIYQFSTAGNRFNFLTPPNTSTFRVVDNGAATASTNIDCSGAIPATATHFWGRLLSAAAGGITTFMANPDIGAASTTNFIVAIGPGNIAWIDYPVSTTQQINYMSSPAAGSLKLDIGGFLFTR